MHFVVRKLGSNLILNANLKGLPFKYRIRTLCVSEAMINLLIEERGELRVWEKMLIEYLIGP